MVALIVDDDNLIVAMMSRLVSTIKDVTPVTFTDPLQALDWCQLNEPDLVLVDYQMPGLNGLDFIKAFRSIPGKKMVPVIMATSETDEAIKRKAFKLKANDFVSKPVNLLDLKARISNMLGMPGAPLPQSG